MAILVPFKAETNSPSIGESTNNMSAGEVGIGIARARHGSEVLITNDPSYRPRFRQARGIKLPREKGHVSSR
jgi:hypothetical protein